MTEAEVTQAPVGLSNIININRYWVLIYATSKLLEGRGKQNPSAFVVSLHVILGIVLRLCPQLMVNVIGLAMGSSWGGKRLQVKKTASEVTHGRLIKWHEIHNILCDLLTAGVQVYFGYILVSTSKRLEAHQSCCPGSVVSISSSIFLSHGSMVRLVDSKQCSQDLGAKLLKHSARNQQVEYSLVS